MSCHWFDELDGLRRCPVKDNPLVICFRCGSDNSSRARTRKELYRLFPRCKPRYSWRQKRLLKHAAMENFFARPGYVHPFSEEELRALMLEVDHWLRVMLFAHYWERDPKLTWEEFLSLTRDREDISRAAGSVLYLFPDLCRPDLDVFDHRLWPTYARTYDYVDREDLIPADRSGLPLLVSEAELKHVVNVVLHKLEVMLYVQKKAVHRKLRWRAFLNALETQPILTEVLLQRTRWLFSANVERFKELWSCEMVLTPPLRLT